MPPHLEPFHRRWAETILAWVQTSEELCYWSARRDFPLTDPTVFETWHDDPDISAYVLLIGPDEPIGYGEVWLDRDDDSAELARLIIAPEYRRRKFGTYLIEQLINLPVTATRQRVWVRLIPSNIPAAICYQAAGFARSSLDVERELNAWQRFQFLWMSRAQQIPR